MKLEIRHEGMSNRMFHVEPSLVLGATVWEEWCPHWDRMGETAAAVLAFPHHTYRCEMEDGRTVLHTPNDVMLINPGDVSRRDGRYRQRTRGDWLWVPHSRFVDALAEYDPAVRDRADRPFGALSLPFSSGLFLRQRLLYGRLESGAETAPLFVEEMAASLLADVARRMAALAGGGSPPVSPSTRRAHHRAVQRALELISANLHRSLHLAEIARVAGVSETHFCGVFRREVGTSIHSYVTDLKMKTALARLGDYRGDLLSLALDLGYDHLSHFSGRFRQRFGVSPRRALALLDRGALPPGGRLPGSSSDGLSFPDGG